MSAITKKKVIKWIWIIGGLLFTIPILLSIFDNNEYLSGDEAPILFIFGLILIIANIFLAFKYYNLIIVFILIELMGLGFKLFHFPGADAIIILGTLLLLITFIIAFFNFVKKNKLPTYINRLGTASSLIAAITFLALAFSLNRYPGAQFLSYISVSSLIIIILALVFTLPNSGFVDWSKRARTIFFRALMIPLAFLFIITATIRLYPKVFQANTSEDDLKFKMQTVELFNKEGLAN